MTEPKFLWLPMKINGKWKWLIHVLKVKDVDYMCIDGKIVQVDRGYKYIEV